MVAKAANMADLERFRAKVREYRLLVERNQAALASYLNLDYTELSNRLNASKNAHLTHANTRAIVRALAEWGAITTRSQAQELLDLAACPYFDEVDWQAKPLTRLVSGPDRPPVGWGQVSTPTSPPQPLLPASEAAPSQHLLTRPKPKPNLPVQITSFVGRQPEIAEIKRLLLTPDEAGNGHRLLTLTGPGGVGKTRLALQAAAQLAGDYREGVRLVELAALSSPAYLPQTVAGALGLPEQPGKPVLPTLIEHLGRQELLLVLDNCEHLIESAAHLAASLLRACPYLHILATSRESLEIAGETVFNVPSLGLPSEKEVELSLEALPGFDAVRLFMDRAHSSNPKFRLTAQNFPALVQVLQHLDGLPLAIELAAARTKILTIEQINARLTGRFQLLTSGNRAGLPRQQTLRGLIDWSYDLLSGSEQSLFRRLSVLAGSWSLEAAELVGGPGLTAAEILDLVAQLANKSLLVIDEPENEGEVLYHYLETIRQYGQEKLLDSGEEKPWENAIVYLETAGDQARHANAFGKARLCYAGALEAFSHLTPTFQNSSQRVEVLLKQAAVSLPYSDGPAQLTRLLGEAETQLQVYREQGRPDFDPLQLARLHYWLARYLYLGFNYSRSLYYSQLVLEEAQKLENAGLVALSYWMKSRVLIFRGHYKQAKEVLGQAIELLGKTGNETDRIQAVIHYSLALTVTGHYAEGLAELEQARIYCSQPANQLYLPQYYVASSWVHLAAGNIKMGLEANRLAIEKARPIDDWNLLHSLVLKGLFESYLGQFQAAEQSMAEANLLLQRYAGRIAATDIHRAIFALINLNLGKYDRAIELAWQALDLAREAGGLYSEGIAERVLGQAFTASGPEKYPEAETHLAASVRAFETGGAVLFSAQSYSAWGDLAARQGQWEAGLGYYHQARSRLEAANLTAESEAVSQRIAGLEAKRKGFA